jgi:hypothetical protein
LKNIYNEEEYAKKILKEKKLLSGRIQFQFNVLAKYWFFTEGYNKAEVKAKLIEFCEKYVNGFNFNINYKMVNNAISHLSSKKCQYVRINEIFVSDEFVQYFVHLDLPFNTKKFLFSLAVFGKINSLLGRGEEFVQSNSNFRDIQQASDVKLEGNFWDDFVKKMTDNGILRATAKGSLKLLFLNDIPEGNEIYKISDFHNLGLWYDVYCGDRRRKICEKCGRIFKKRTAKSNSQIYCYSCSKNKQPY